MESTNEETKPKSKLKGILVIVVIVVAAVAGAYYISIPHTPPQFTMVLNPPFFHASPGGWGQVLVEVSRMPGFNAGINVSLVNPPGWTSVNSLVINSTSINGTLTFQLTNQAQYGTYQLSVAGSVASGPGQTVPVSMKVVSVTPVTSQYGSGSVYDTTKSLDSGTLAALVSYVNGTLQFSKTTSQLDNLDVGDVIVAPPNTTQLVPKGFLLTVLDVRKAGETVLVDTRLAGLTEVFQELHFGHNPPISGSSGLSTSAIDSHPTDDVTNLCNTITCVTLFNWKAQPDNLPAHLSPTGQGDVTLDAYIKASAYAYAYGDISCCSNGVSVDFGLLALAHEEAYAGIMGSRGSHIIWPDNVLTTITSVNIQIFPGLLWIDINLNLDGQGSGILKEDVNANIDQYFNVIVGPTYNGGLPSAVQSYCEISGSGWDFCHYHDFLPPTTTFTIGLPTTTGDTYPQGGQPDWPMIAIGPKLSADVDGVAGLSFELFAYFLLNTGTGVTNSSEQGSWPCEPNYCPIWVLYFGIGATISLWINIQVWKASFGVTWPRLFQWEIAHADNYPPSNPVLGPPSASIDLSNPSFLSTNPIDWVAVMPLYGASFSCTYQNGVATQCSESGSGVPSYTADPEGENVTCTWMSKEVGELGESPAYNTHNEAYPGSQCAAPPLTSFPVGEIIAQGLTQLTVYVTAADAGGKQSQPSNTETLQIILPTPVLSIQYPTSGMSVYQNQPFTSLGTARVSTTITTSTPNGIIDLCQTEPQNIAWYVGGSFEADIVDVGEGGWVNAQFSGLGCNPTLTAKSSGQTTVYMVLLSTDPQTSNQYIAQTSNGNPLHITSTVINVQPAPTQPQPGGLSIQIITPTEPSNSPPHTPTSNPTVELQGTLTGGTAPYLVTWQGSWDGQTTTIAKGLKYNTLDYNWQVCMNGYPWFGFYGTITVTLSVIDSKGLTAQATSPPGISINFNCAVAQAFPPIPITGGLAGLLAVLFAMTGERVKMKPYSKVNRGDGH
ncbi:MAG: hypothetical protein ACLPY5_14150 [Candidatus Bathyarchaeia archaeon]